MIIYECFRYAEHEVHPAEGDADDWIGGADIDFVDPQREDPESDNQEDIKGNDDERDEPPFSVPKGFCMPPPTFKADSIMQEVSKLREAAKAKHPPGTDVDSLWCFGCNFADDQDPSNKTNPLVAMLCTVYTQSAETVGIGTCCETTREFYEREIRPHNPLLTGKDWDPYTIWVHFNKHAQTSKGKDRMWQKMLEDIAWRLANDHIFFKHENGKDCFSHTALIDFFHTLKAIDISYSAD